jgi:hypothetical protein
MEIKHYLIAVLVFGVVITGFWSVLGDAQSTYGVEVDDEFAAVYGNISDTMAEVRDDSRDIRDDIRSSEAEETDQFGGSLIKGAFNSLRLIWNSWDSVVVTIEKVQEEMGIPDYFVLAFMTIIVILISFAIISAVFKHPL